MTLFAFTDGETIFSENNLNPLIAAHPYQLIYEGTQIDGINGSGVVENSLATANRIARFSVPTAGKVGRVELKLDRDENGADVDIEIRSGFNPDGTTLGDLVYSILLPKEFVGTSASMVSLPVGLSSLAEGYYWLLLKQSGDATNDIEWVGESSANGSYPTYYRNGETGAWTSGNALHFSVHAEARGNMKHTLYSSKAFTILEYEQYNGKPRNSKVMVYVPPAASTPQSLGIRQIFNQQYDGKYLIGGESE